MTTLDADDPLVLDTRALGGRAGAMITVHRTVPAPDGWRVSSTSVEPGTPIDLRLRLESVVEGVLVSGTAECVTSAECSRCLDPVAGTLTIGVQQLFEYHAPAARADEDTDPLPTLDGDLLDLQPTLRDAVVLDLPLVPLCSIDCPGLCAICGARLADDPGHHHDQPDDRWGALQGWDSGTEDLSAAAGTHQTHEKGD